MPSQLLMMGSGGGPAIAAPSNLSAVAVSSSQIDLTWTDNTVGEDGFKIERAPAAIGPWAQIGTAAANATTYSDLGLTGSTTYYYRVRSYSGSRNSDYSNTANATTASAQFTVSYTTNLLQQMYSDQLIWQASALTTPAMANNDPVGGWASTTGDKPLIQTTAGARPLLKTNQINGFPSVRFDGVDDSLKALFALTRPFHVFLVIKQITWGLNNRVVDGAVGDVWGVKQRSTSPGIAVWNGAANSGENANLAIGVWGIVELLCSAAESRLRINNTVATAPSVGPAGDIGGLNLASLPANSNYSSIDVAAHLAYSADIGSTNRDTVVTELAARYGISL